MKTIFDELEAEVDQNAVNRKYDEIERKNILIANDTLFANCLSKEVFYIATNFELNVSRFFEMHEAHTVVQACFLELETKLSKLKDKIQKDDHDVMVKCFSNLECPLTRFTHPKVVPAKQPKNVSTIRFGNDHFGAIMGYGDYVTGDSVISRVYYVEGICHNLFSVKQLCDYDLEVAFRKHSCYVCDTYDVELIKGSCGQIMVVASSLNHLNFGTINDLARKDLVRRLPRLKFEKDHLCFACQLEKSKKHTHLPKAENTNLEVLNTLYMDLCRPMKVKTINKKKYILVIVDDYTRFTGLSF
uniref:Integrase, catalytic region, zinc finger, CCHC-type, peptidase aspartic, catalytic n=1 Tax=Tanacetum cinerariifolium TaxID=118510 RepID=A0A699KVS0_TANCI|nr:hypothetical protein [Tanacetum cinerariifolium]